MIKKWIHQWKSPEAKRKRLRKRNPALAKTLDIFEEVEGTAYKKDGVEYVKPTKKQLEDIDLLLRVMR